MAYQVVKNQQKTGQIKRDRLQVRVFALSHFSDGLSDKGENWPSATLWQIVEKQQQKLKVLHIEVIVPMNWTLNGMLLQSSQKPDVKK